MGQFINVGNEDFKMNLADTYIDKTPLISIINSRIATKKRFCCITRCRRFGKSMAASMLCAYYDKSCDSRELFRGLAIEKDTSIEKHLNKYPVIYIDMSNFTPYFGFRPAEVKSLRDENGMDYDDMAKSLHIRASGL